jgi:nucleoside-diphosphate-sugar epimerase
VGDDVFATTRGPRADALSRAGLTPLTIDVTASVLPAFPVFETVVYAVGRDRTRDDTMFDIHVNGLRTVLNALDGSTGRVIYVSSTGVYAQDTGEWVDEESRCEPVDDGGRACLCGERLLLGHARGDDAIVLRLAGLYGPGRVPQSADVAAGATITGSPDAFVNRVHVDDAAAAVVAAATRSVTRRTFVVSDSHPTTRREYVGSLAARLGVLPPSFKGGGGLGKRVRNDRAVHELGLRLKYPSYREALSQ